MFCMLRKVLSRLFTAQSGADLHAEEAVCELRNTGKTGPNPAPQIKPCPALPCPALGPNPQASLAYKRVQHGSSASLMYIVRKIQNFKYLSIHIHIQTL